jgi:UDP-glucose 4-epimerase
MEYNNILITGAAGFIGSNLSSALLERNYRVIAVDNLSQGSLNNIREELNHPNFRFEKIDVRDFDSLMKVSDDVSIIVHLAAFKIPRYGNAKDTLLINTKGTENVLEVARNKGCKVILGSTSDVYGKNPELTFNEESALVMGSTKVARWSYAVSKMYDEHLCFAYSDEYGIPVVILRFFGGYGPRQNLTWWGGPQSVFINAALDRKPISIHGDGQQTRTFTYITDIVNCIILAMENEKAAGEIFNVGYTSEISIIELARLIWRLVGHEDEPLIEFVPYAKFHRQYEDVRRRVPDISKARRLL